VAKSVHDDVLDAALSYIQTNCTRICACSSQPTTYTEATVTYELADVIVDTTDFAIANGDTNGRKLTVSAQTNVTVDNSGTYGHLALVDVANSKLLYVTTGTSQVLTAGDTVHIPAWDIEIAEPSKAMTTETNLPVSGNAPWFAGESKDLNVTITSGGGAYDLTGASLTFTLSKTVGGTALITKTTADGITVTDESGGLATVALGPGDTSGLSGTYHWEVRVVDASLNEDVVAYGTAKIRASSSD